MEIIDSGLLQPLAGAVQGENIVHTQKTYKDAKEWFESVDLGLVDDTVLYDVYSSITSPCSGSLNWGVTILHSVFINGECNMTRGHFHEDQTCQEMYWCQSGEGLLMLMDDDKTWAEKMYPGSLHRIEGTIAHRLINTSDADLVVVACWPSQAGHDYKKVEDHPFGYRVFKNEIKERRK